MAEYDVGTGYLQIVPSFKGFESAVTSQMAQVGDVAGQVFAKAFSDRVRRATDLAAGPSTSTSTRAGASSGGAFADAFKARVEAALASLPDPKVGLDATELDAELADIRTKLEALGDARVGVDIDAAAATAELDSLKARIDELGARSPDINVKVDAARASAELAAVQAEVSALNGETASVGVTDGRSAGAVLGELGNLQATLAALSPLAIPVGASLAAGFAGVATVVASVTAGLGVFALGVSGVANAVKLLGQEHTAAAADATRAASAETSAGRAEASAAASVRSATEALKNARQTANQQAIASAEQVANARQALADAERNADNQIRQATEQVAQAKYSETEASQSLANAEQALNDAREQAIRDLQTYADNATDANLSVQQSQIDLTEAQQQYQQDLADPTVTPLQLQQDALNIAKAQQALVEAQQQATDATQDNNKAQKEGVDGAPGVVNATQQVAQAKHDQRDAARQVADAERAQQQAELDAAESIKKAQQGLTDAIRNQANQQRQSAYAVETAQNSLADATRAAGDASAAAGATGQSALQKIQNELRDLNPATRAFATFIVSDLEPALSRIRSVAAAGLLPGVEAGLKAMTPLVKPFTSFVGDLATTMGNLARQAGKALTDPFWTQFFVYVSGTAGPTLATFVHVLENVGKGFAGLVEAFKPITTSIGKGILDLSKSFAAFGAHAGSNSAFQSFLDYVRQTGPQVVGVIGNLAEIAGKLLEGLAPLGAVMLRVLDPLSRMLAALNPTELMLIAAAIADVFGGPVAGAVELVAVAGVVARNWGAIKDAITTALDAIKAAALDIANWFTGPFVGLFTTAWSDVEGIFSAAASWVAGAFSTAWGAVKGVLTGPIKVARDLIKGWIDVNGDILGFFLNAVQWLTGHFADIWGGVKAVLLSPITLAKAEIKGILDVGGDILGFFTNAWDWVSNNWGNIWAGVESVLKAPFTAAEAAISSIWDEIKKGARVAVSAFGTIWDGVKKAFEDPITFVVNTVINDGILRAWNFIADHVPGVPGSLKNLKVTLPSNWATGGVIPGYAPGVDSVLAMVSPGEAILRPEVTRWLGADTIHGWNAAAMSGVLPHFGIGGIVGDVTGAISGAFGKAWDVAKVVGDPVGWLIDKVKAPLSWLDRITGTAWGQLVASVPKAVGTELVNALKSLVGLGGGGGDSSAGPAPATLSAIQAMVKSMAAQMFGWVGAQWNDLYAVIMRESGFDPTAQNPTSTAYGIYQFLDSTWAGYGIPKTSDPTQQTIAGLRYIHSRYGDPAGALAHENAYGWYDAGGIASAAGALLKRTVQPERVLSPEQTVSFEKLVSVLTPTPDLALAKAAAAAVAAGGSSGPAAFTGELYLDSGEFLGVVSGQAHAVVDGRVKAAQARARRGVAGGPLKQLERY